MSPRQPITKQLTNSCWLLLLLPIMTSSASAQNEYRTFNNPVRPASYSTNQNHSNTLNNNQLNNNQLNLEILSRRLETAESRIHELETAPPAPTAGSTIPACDDCTPLTFYTEYDKGFQIKPYDKKKTPFSLKINGRIQFDYNHFQRDKPTYTNLEKTYIIKNRSEFEIERVRLVFSGFVFDPALTFYAHIDADTDAAHNTTFLDFSISYKFSEAFKLTVGKRKVTGSYAFWESSSKTHLIGRSMATTFFRQDRSVGLWAEGKLGDEWYYSASITNSFIGGNLRRKGIELDREPYVANMLWWEPLGEFGKGYADLKQSDSPLIRIGSSIGFGRIGNLASSKERGAFRISDGSKLEKAGFGITGFRSFHYTADFALKYQGIGFNAEYYWRSIQDIDYAAASEPFSKLTTDGFYADLGYMIVPKKLELAGRLSTVDGQFGSRWEYAGGLNWYLSGHNNKLMVDVTSLNGSPVSSSSPDLELGMDGLLYRFQWQLAF